MTAVPPITVPALERFDATDAFDGTGIECCPVCGVGLTLRAGPVRTADGRRWESIHATDPADAPFFCESCYHDAAVDELASQHRTLDRFAVADVDWLG